MTKTPITIAILTLIALAGVFWFVQNNKEEKEIVSVDKVVQKTREKNAVSSEQKETLQEKQTPEQKEEQKSPKKEENEKTSKITYNPDGSIDTSNWKEYCNKEFGFCLKYPGEWKIKMVRNRRDGINFSVVDNIKWARADSGYTETTVMWVEFSRPYAIGMEGFDMYREKVMVDGVSAWKTVWVGSVDQDNPFTVTTSEEGREFDKKYMMIIVSGHDLVINGKRIEIKFSGDKSKKKYFDAFLKTFRFIK